MNRMGSIHSLRNITIPLGKVGLRRATTNSSLASISTLMMRFRGTALTVLAAMERNSSLLKPDEDTADEDEAEIPLVPSVTSEAVICCAAVVEFALASSKLNGEELESCGVLLFEGRVRIDGR